MQTTDTTVDEKQMDFNQKEKFIKSIVQKLYEYPSLHRSMLWANGDCIAWVEYFSTETIIEAIRSILSPTKAKDENNIK